MKCKILLFPVIIFTILNTASSQTELDSMIHLENSWSVYFLLPDSLKSDSLYFALRLQNKTYFEEEFLPKLPEYSKRVNQGDTALMKKYIEYMVEAKNSANEAINITLAKMFYSWPDVFLRQVLEYDDEQLNILVYQVVWGLFNVFCGENDWKCFDKLYHNIPSSSQDSLRKYYPEFQDRY